ncbi:DUF4194 domain-containing protein [Desulfococcaceae bacterium HSG8]|nr:DUF4194 domain-containing protein [Desulfococcaceae bacterium HSG8]
MPDEIYQNRVVPHAPVIIKLLQGTLFDEDAKMWNDLLIYHKQVRDYFSQIGIDLYMDERDGFAFLTQRDTGEDAFRIPRLVRRMPLSYDVTLFLVILRESLEEFDVRTTDSSRCFITRQQIMEKIELLFKERSDTVKLLSRFDAYVNQVINMGFLKPVEEAGEPENENRYYEIRRVIKAKINNEKLEEIREKLGKDC